MDVLPLTQTVRAKRKYNLTGQFHTGCFQSMFASEINLNCPTNFLDIELMYCSRASVFVMNDQAMKTPRRTISALHFSVRQRFVDVLLTVQNDLLTIAFLVEILS